MCVVLGLGDGAGGGGGGASGAEVGGSRSTVAPPTFLQRNRRF